MGNPFVPDRGWVVMIPLSNGKPWPAYRTATRHTAQAYADGLNTLPRPHNREYKVVPASEFQRQSHLWETARRLGWL